MERDKNNLGVESARSKQRVSPQSINSEAEVQAEISIFLVLDFYYRTFRGNLGQTLCQFESCQNPRGHAIHIFFVSFEHSVDPTANIALEDLGIYLHGP